VATRPRREAEPDETDEADVPVQLTLF